MTAALPLPRPYAGGPGAAEAAPTPAAVERAPVGARSPEACFAELIELYHQRLEHLAFMLCGVRAQAEDAVAEAYARVWPRYRYGRVREPYAYLRRAVVNQVTGSFRRRALEAREERRGSFEPHPVECAEDAVVDHELLRPALLTLPTTQRVVVVLRFLEDLSEDDTAALLGLAPGTVKSRTARGLQQLRRLLGEAEGG